jgi:CheY-like chemotaxis protein
MRVLLVDDDTSSTEALCELLKLAGHDVVCADNGQKALDKLHEDHHESDYCVILLDLMMPVMNGYEFREEQLKDPSIASIPIIVITADGRAREKAAQLGSDRYFLKPLIPAELLRAIGEYCPIPPRGGDRPN